MDSSQFREAEHASRIKVSLNTVGDEHFDQVVAMSQGMINHAIKRIHEQNEDMNDFYGDSDSGSIAADLDPSELVVPVGDGVALNNNMVIWRTNIKKGTLTVNFKDVPPKEYTMDGWSIDIRVPLTFENFDDLPDDLPETRDYKQERRKWIRENFEVPGDYRPERLYAKMANGRWADITFAGASFLVDGKPRAYEKWKREGNNGHVSNVLESIFKDLSLQREAAGMTTIGTTFKLDAAKIIERPATFPPVTMIHQTFPYKIGPESGVIGWDKGIQSIQDPGSRNCLLYCENVDTRQMTGKQLPQTGNYTTIGGSNNPDTRVEGSFVLSHQLIFEKFLLPHLQGFVMEAQVYPLPGSYHEDSDGSEGLYNSYVCGKNPSKDPNRDPNNSIYKFHPVSNGNEDAHYEAFVEVTSELPVYHFPRSGDYAKYWSEGSPHVTVKWQKGGNRITVSGKTNYTKIITSARHSNVDSSSHQISPADGWVRGRYLFTWEVHIDLSVKDGGLDMSITHDRDSFVKVVNNSDIPKFWTIATQTPEEIRSNISRNMTTRLQHLEQVLREGFAHQYKFIYPGNGQLTFKNSMFTEHGDLIAEIGYQDTAGANKIVIPPPKRTPDHPPTDPGHGDDPGSKNKARLQWTANTPVKSSDSPVEVRITGKNTSTSVVYLSKLQVKYTGLKLATEIFKAIKFVTANGGKDDVEISVQAESTSKMSTPVLNIHNITSKKTECTVTYEAETSPIAVQPGGSIHLIAKGATGKSGTEKDLGVTETWCDHNGKTPEGNDSYLGWVKVKLS